MIDNTFTNAIINQDARTENGMKALDNTTNPVVDLFYAIGASRGKDIIPVFAKAFATDRDLSIRIALWARDVREGSGERKIFRDIVDYVSNLDRDLAKRMIARAPELGRWDDVISPKDSEVRRFGFDLVRDFMLKHKDYVDLLNRIETMSDEEAKLHLASLGIDQNEIAS